MVNPGNTLQDCEEPFLKGWKYKMAGDKIGKKKTSKKLGFQNIKTRQLYLIIW